jgi:hypothetical protein
MTGFKSKKIAALDEEGMYLVHQTEAKPVQKVWDTPSNAFNKWWNSDYDDTPNPFEVDSFGYWAWAGWQAALAQPAQELWCMKMNGCTTKCDDCPDEAAQPAQESPPWVDLTDEEISDIGINNPPMVHEFARAVLAKSKEKNNG